MAATSLAVSIVLHRPDRDVLENTLHSVASAVGQAIREGLLERAELILRDHSPEPQPASVQEGWRQLCGSRLTVVYVSDPSNPGFGSGHNRSFERAGKQAEYFLVANPDLEFEAESLSAGLRFFAAHPSTGLLAASLIQRDGPALPACFRPPDLLTLALRLLGGPLAETRSHRYECRDWDGDLAVFNPPLLSGCCMLFRSECFAGLNGFDPRYFLYFEDFDISRRAGLQGKTAYCPGLRVRHSGGKTARKGIRHVWQYLRSARRYFDTYGWRLR